MNKHTEGEWERNLSDTCIIGIHKKVSPGVIIKIADVSYDPSLINPGEHEANAKLIAAAPQLLAECKKQIVWLQHVRQEIVVPDSIGMGFDQAIRYLTEAVQAATE